MGKKPKVAFGNKPKPPAQPRCYIKIMEYASGANTSRQYVAFRNITVYSTLKKVEPVLLAALKKAEAAGELT